MISSFQNDASNSTEYYFRVICLFEKLNILKWTFDLNWILDIFEIDFFSFDVIISSFGIKIYMYHVSSI